MSLEDLTITDQSLGAGGFGSVCVCQLGRIKVAGKQLSKSEKKINNLTREASKLRKLRHGKHITYIYGITLKNENPYMVMEYCELGDLQNYLITSKESVAYDQKILFCRGILLGLLYCHSMKVFHGDIKGSNVLLGENLEPKLTDFGLSMTVNNIEGYCKKSEGSLYWTSPELFSIRDETVYKKFIADPYPCDVYSLGATFCEISYDGTTGFIESDDPDMDIMLGHVSPTPKNAFLQELVNGCCQFERNERISLDKCLSMLDAVAEEQLLIPEDDDCWEFFQSTIRTSSEQPIPPSFILCRPSKNLVVGPSNLSLLEWLCISDNAEAVEYIIQQYKPEKKQLEWLCGISILCKSQNTVESLRVALCGSELTPPKLSDLIDENPWQFIESLIEAGADCNSYSLLKKAIEKHYNVVVQAIVDRGIYLNDWFVHEAIKAGNAWAVRIFAFAGVGLEHVDKNGNTPLLAAIDAGNTEIVEILLDFNVNIKKGNKYTPLYSAVLNGNKEIVALLISAGATEDIGSNKWQFIFQYPKSKGDSSMAQLIIDAVDKRNIESAEKSTLLCTAIRQGQLGFVEDLIYNEVYINGRDHNGCAPLHWAVLVGDEKIVKALIDAGADIEIRTPSKDQYISSPSRIFNEYTPLHLAVETECLEIVRLLIKSGADLSKKNGLGQTIEEIATEEDRKEIEKIILERVWIKKDSFGKFLSSISSKVMKKLIDRQALDNNLLFDCLCVAVKHGNEEIVEYLIEYGADISWTCEDKNLLELAISENQAQIVQILIEKGIDVNARNSYDQTPLFRCVKESQIEIMQILIDREAGVNIKDIYKNTPIHFATDIKVAEILIEAGAEIDAIGKYNETALIRCVEASKAEMVKFLIEKGANVNIKTACDKAPIFFAENLEVVKILVEAGADVNAKIRNGRTPLFQFVEKSCVEIVQFLADNGADVNTRDNSGNAPIHCVRNKEIAEILIAHSVDIKAEDERGRRLSLILVQEQNENLDKANSKEIEVTHLQDYLAISKEID